MKKAILSVNLSEVSHSVDEQLKGIRKKIVLGKYSKLDRLLFPLYESTLKSVTFPDIIYAIAFLFWSLQILSTSLWPTTPGFIDYTQSDANWIRIYFSVIYFNNMSHFIQSKTAFIIAISLIVFLSYLILGGMVFYFKQHRRFIRWTLYVARFVFELVPFVLMIPIAKFSGIIFFIITYAPTVSDVLIFIFSLIDLFLIVALFYITQTFMSLSPYISTSITTCWNGFIIFLVPSMISLFIYFPPFLSHFKFYITAIWILIKIGFDLFMLVEAALFPFVVTRSNAVLGALFGGSFFGDIVAFIAVAFDKKPTNKSLFAILYVTFALSLIVLYILYGSLVRKIRKILKYSTYFGEGDQSLDENFNQVKLFEKYKLDKQPLICELFMRIGLGDASPMFIDMSLVKYVVTIHRDKIFSCIRFVSLFPAEITFLNILFRKALSSEKLTLGQRFLLYQINEVQDLRNSSTTDEVNEFIFNLQAMTRRKIAENHLFWKSIPNNIFICQEMKAQIDQIKARYREAIEKWPNNIRLRQDYHTFLVEGATEFGAGVKAKCYSDLVEEGQNFAVDHSFKSLLRAYPIYVKKNIVESDGFWSFNPKDLIKKNSGKNCKMSHSMVCSNGTLTDASSLFIGASDGSEKLDYDVEEKYAKALFNYSKLRLAYERALDSRTSINSRNLKISLFWTLVLMFAMFLFVFFYTEHLFDESAANIQLQLILSRIRLDYDRLLHVLVIDWLYKEGSITPELFQLMSENIIENESINLTDDLMNEAFRWIELASYNFDSFYNSINTIAQRSLNTFLIPANYTICNDGSRIIYPNSNLRFVISSMVVTGSYFLIEDNPYNESDTFCELLNNARSFFNVIDETSMGMHDDEITLYYIINGEMNIIIIPIPVFVLLISLPFSLVFLTRYFKELSHLIKLMKEVDPEAQCEASENILINRSDLETDESNTFTDMDHKTTFSKWHFYVLIILPEIVAIAIFFGAFLIAYSSNATFLDINKWVHYGVYRNNYAIEISALMGFLIGVTSNAISTDFFTAEETLSLINILLDSLTHSNNALIHGDPEDGVKSIIGVSESFDNANIYDQCDWNFLDNVSDYGPYNFTYETVFKCFGLNRLIKFYVEHVYTMLNNIHKEKIDIASNFYYLWEIANNKILANDTRASKILADMSNAEISNTIDNQRLICIITIVIFFIYYMFLYYLTKKLDGSFNGLYMLLKRLPPPSVISNEHLYSYLLGKSVEKDDPSMTGAKKMVQISKKAVIFLSRNETIEQINPSVTNLFGYMPDQILGQHISVLLQDNKELEQQFVLMRNGESNMHYEFSTVATTDNETEVPVFVYLLGFGDNSNDKVAKSFVLILRDQSVLVAQQKEAEEAKKKSEALLYSILPRDIVIRLDSGETDISFTVPIASILFIDIVKFSNYSAMLSPSQIMENLSLIFASFDQKCSTHPSITKIKLIGDVYMAASGLFNDESFSTEAAIETIRFCLEALQALEEVNSILNASLQVRIGVNTNGPIIAGVLGKDKPVFDIIGDPINVAARLQSNGIPGTVQISQSTYERVNNGEFDIELRGEIMLKGKGKKLAYIIRPHAKDSMFFQKSNSSNGDLAEQQTVPS